MIDKETNNISKEMILKKVCLVAKENVALIAIAIPIVIAIFGYAVDWYFYLYNLGYYKCFGIDGSLMLPYNRTGIYHYLGQLAWGGLYWAYAILTVRITLSKRKTILKGILLVIVPTIVNVIIVYSSYRDIDLWLVIACLLLIPVHWLLAFYLGYGILPSSYQKVLDLIVERRKKRKIERLGDKEFRLLGIILIVGTVILIFWQGYHANYRRAVDQRRFGIVNINEEKYAVIDSNEKKLILQKCEIDQTTLKIDKNTYLCIGNETLINFYTFDEVEIK